MTDDLNSASSFSYFRTSIRRKPVHREQLAEVSVDSVKSPFLLQVNARVEGVLLHGWATENRELIDEGLLKYGALLFRGFSVPDVADFRTFVRGICGELLEYQERSSPRTLVQPGVYSSTDYPCDQRIFFHNENSYQHQWPLKIVFHCVCPAEQGGATPLSSIRGVTGRINRAILDKFAEKGVLYQRTYSDEIGLPWRVAFQTSSRDAVEQYCQRAHIIPEWISRDRLRTKQVRPALVRHPRTNDSLWFNHAAFFHVSTLDSEVGAALLSTHDKNELPSNTYYGDGAEIESNALENIRQAYEGSSMRFPWQLGDVLVLDNMLVAHGREPFKGKRRVVVAMAEIIERDELR